MTDKKTKFATGDLVRVKHIGGPKMLIGAVHLQGSAYSCGWFSKDDEWQMETFNEAMLELVKGTP